jgi:hypothetical protein
VTNGQFAHGENPIARVLWQFVVSARCRSWGGQKAVIGTAGNRGVLG